MKERAGLPTSFIDISSTLGDYWRPWQQRLDSYGVGICRHSTYGWVSKTSGCMAMLEIYKKLPGTNCRDCGEPSCMAFALKVKTSQRSISECPYVTEPDEAASPTEHGAPTDDMYEGVANQMEEEVMRSDFKKVAVAIGGDFEVAAGAEIIRLTMADKPYEIRKEGLFEGGEYCRDSWVKMIIYDYVRRGGDQPVTADWVAFDHFPKTPSHVKAFQKTAETTLAASFDEDPQALVARFEDQGGTEEKGEVKADYSCRLELLPRVPLLLRFWAADDEFPAGCKLFVDSSANAYLDMEFLGHLVEKFVENVTGNP